MKFKRIVAGGLAGVAALTLSTLVPTVAHADNGNDCPKGNFCAWEDVMYSGRVQVDPLTSRSAHYDFGVSSYWNRTGFPVCASFRNNSDHRRKALRILPGEQTAWLDDGWNDNIVNVIPAEDTVFGACGGF